MLALFNASYIFIFRFVQRQLILRCWGRNKNVKSQRQKQVGEANAVEITSSNALNIAVQEDLMEKNKQVHGKNRTGE